MLIAVAGVSGSGKNTVINEILKKKPNMKFMPKSTTRKKREGEKEGNPYFFLTKKQFKEGIKKGIFFEYLEVHKGTLYGTRKDIYKELSKKYDCFIADVDVKGIMAFKEQDFDIVSIFLDVPKEELWARLVARGEKDIEKRLSRFDLEMENSKNMDYIIENTDLNKTVSRIIKIIEHEAEKRGLKA